MPMTISNTTGDGITSNYEDYDIEIPDSGSSILVTGTVQGVGLPAQALSGSPLTFPTPPASGVINVIVQASLTTGALTLKQNTTAGILPATDAGNGLAYSIVISPVNTDLAIDPNQVTPDTA